MAADAGERRVIKVQLMMSAAELREVDDWRFATRIASRAEAIRTLLRSALAQLEEEAAARPGTPPPSTGPAKQRS